MYIEKIDELLNAMIDMIFMTLQKENLLKQKKYTTQEILKVVNNIMIDIKKTITNEFSSIQDILELLFKKFIYLYIFASIRKNFKNEVYINFLLEFTKNDIIFNSEFNSKILYVGTVLEQLQFITTHVDDFKNNKIKNRYEYTLSLQIFKEYGPETINFVNNESIHNILKIILYENIYIQDDKLKIYNILEKEELDKHEYKYIEIIETNLNEIEYVSIESLFQNNKLITNFIEDIYNIMITQDNIDIDNNNKLTLDYKINKLFEQKIIIPITDEFLRYHKDSERYDIGITDKVLSANISKKDNTKIRYIINKINQTLDIYKSKKIDYNNIFFQSLINRKVILINDLEEINILQKKANIGQISLDQSEYYNDLKIFRIYPYINFQDFKNNGFSIKSRKTIEAIRYSNIEFKNDIKYSYVLKNQLETRVISNYLAANIIGIAIPKKSVLSSINSTIIQCTLIKNTIDINTLDKSHNISNSITNNITNNIIKLIKNLILNNNEYSKLTYWIFNKHIDRLNKFKDQSNLPQDEYFKFILSYLYDEISVITYEKIINELNSNIFINFYKSYQLIKNIQSKLIDVSILNFYKIEQYLFLNKSPFFKDEYDLEEDKIPGINKKLIKIPSFVDVYQKKKKLKIYKDEHVESYEKNIYENSYCQHNITWNRITALRNKSPNKFNQELNDFYKYYIIENTEHEFICKSCSEIINLKKYINDWTSSTDENIALSVSLNARLEELPEYEKYNKSIVELDKYLEKICYGINYNILIGKSPQIKIKRQEIIKMLIDLINNQNEIMKTMSIIERKKRLELAIKNYGISRDLSQFFIFELKNDIFIYSSNDLDKFKIPKINNIMTYLILLLLNEISFSLILYFPDDKLLNYFIFDKFGYDLFDGLYIRVNSANDVSSIKDYKLLCYVIFILSGLLIKYKLWHNPVAIQQNNLKKNIINPMIQKIIIHTLVDLLNSILDINTKSTKNIIYEIFSSKFFVKLRLVYSKKASANLLLQLDESIKKKITINSDKKIIFGTYKNIFTTSLTGKYEYPNFGYSIPSKINIKYNFTNLNISRKLYDNLTSSQIKKIYEKFKQSSLNKFALKNFLDEKTSNIEKIQNEYLQKKIRTNIKYNEKYLLLQNQHIKKIEDNITKINNISSNKFDIYEKINSLLIFFETIIGKDININNENIYLKHNTYIINHNYRGNTRQNIIIPEFENKIFLKKDDPFFKQNIYYYWDKIDNLTLYYNAQDYNYLGYKEQGKDYVLINNSSCSLQVILAIKNKLLYLGHSFINYKIPDEILDLLKSNDSKILKEAGSKILLFISDIIRNRIGNIKNIILNIQRIFNQIKNKFNNIKSHPIAKIFSKKFKYIETKIASKNIFFDQLNIIIDSAFFKKIDPNTSIKLEKDYIYVGNLIKLQNIDHILIIYICDQIKSLIDANNDIFTKTNLIYLFSDIINYEFNFFILRETALSNSQVKKFTLMESNFFNKIEADQSNLISNLSESQIQELEEELIEQKELNDALDVDTGDVDNDNDDIGEQISRQYFTSENNEN